MAYLPTSTFRRCVAKHRRDHKVKDFSCLDPLFVVGFDEGCLSSAEMRHDVSSLRWMRGCNFRGRAPEKEFDLKDGLSSPVLDDLGTQVVARARLLARIYYSASPRSIVLLDTAIDRLVERTTHHVADDESRSLILALADLFSHLPMAGHVLHDLESRQRFFVDLLFEKYNEDVLQRALASYLPP